MQKLQIFLEYIQKGQTGNMEEIAHNLGMSRISVYYYLVELKGLGAGIRWNSERNTYEITNKFNIKLSITYDSKAGY